jgi:hypothetical protein
MYYIINSVSCLSESDEGANYRYELNTIDCRRDS